MCVCGISPHKRKSNFSLCVAYLMVPEISFDCNFDMWSAFSWLFQNLETGGPPLIEVYTGILGKPA